MISYFTVKEWEYDYSADKLCSDDLEEWFYE